MNFILRRVIWAFWVINLFMVFSCKKGTLLDLAVPSAELDSSLTQTMDSKLKVESHVAEAVSDYRNFYGISWRGTAHDNLAYVKQMKYDYVFYQYGMEKDPLSSGLHFYLESPEYSTYNRVLDVSKSYSTIQRQFYEDYCALKSSSAVFPNNLATGWYSNLTTFAPLLDFQQQKVIDWAVDSIMTLVKKIESKNPNFHFGGFAWDVPQPTGDFWSGLQNPGRQVTLAHWNGGDFGAIKKGLTHEYATYSDGRIQFYKQLYKRARAHNSNARFIMEPYRIYEEWINLIQDRPDAKEFSPDILCQEGQSFPVFSNRGIISSGLVVKEGLGFTSPDIYLESSNREHAALAAINGGMFGWYGRFGGTGDMPNYQSIVDVPARLKLIRVLPGWENRNETAISDRKWDGTIYKSPNAFASPDLIYALQPGSDKLFVVFLSSKGQVPVPSGKKAVSIYRTNGLFIETVSGALDLTQGTNGSFKLVNTGFIGAGYIINLANK